MNRFYFITLLLTVVGIFININFYNSQQSVSFSNLALSNVEALATLAEDDKTEFWCCGNSGTCAKGTDETTGEDFEIKGKLSTSPCN